jgi:hypothetical protein
MDSKLQKLFAIFAFYILLSYAVFPIGFYFLIEKSTSSIGNGFVVGSILSIILWFIFGKKMVK